MDYNEILPNLYVGTCPYGPEDVQELKDGLGATAVLCLQTDEDLRERDIPWRAMENAYRKAGIAAPRIPLRDFDYKDQQERLPEAVRALDRLLASGHKVYLHCNAGLGRSPLVAMAYLHWVRKMGPEQAIRHVRERRLCYPYEDLVQAIPASFREEG